MAIVRNKLEISKLISEFKSVTPSGEIFRVGEAIGIRGEKLFDIKKIGRLEEFPLKVSPVLSTEGIPIGRVSEQFSRALSGTLELRKGGKDIRDVILTGEAFVQQARRRVQESPFGIKQFRQFQLARAERKFVELQEVVPKIEFIAGRFGFDVGVLPPKIKKVVAFPTIDLLPPGKRGQTGFGFPSGRLPLEFVPAKVSDLGVPKLPRKVKPFKKGVDLLPSQIKIGKIKPSRFKGFTSSNFLPPSITPSKFPTGFEKSTPSLFDPFIRRGRVPPPIITPSDFPGITPPRTPGVPTLVPTLTAFDNSFEDPFRKKTPRRIKTGVRKLPKKKKKLRREFDIRLTPSFTAIGADLRGAFPKQIKLGKVKLGISPRRIRVLPGKRKRRKK